MVKAIEDSQGGDISMQLQRHKRLHGFETVDNADCSPLQSAESVKDENSSPRTSEPVSCKEDTDPYYFGLLRCFLGKLIY